jgi:hypothetical protein
VKKISEKYGKDHIRITKPHVSATRKTNEFGPDDSWLVSLFGVPDSENANETEQILDESNRQVHFECLHAVFGSMAPWIAMATVTVRTSGQCG